MRDDFTQATKDTLARRVNYLCSNPDCLLGTVGPHTEDSKSVNKGVAAHITAAAPGGKRFDSSLTQEERSSPANGIWLCQNCAKLIDSDEDRFTVTILKEWKNRAEAAVQQSIESNSPLTPEPNGPDVRFRWFSPMPDNRDVFICHASPDKPSYVHPFVRQLDGVGLTYWIDEAEIRWGQSIVKLINAGLAKSRYVVVFFTDNFLNRNWPQTELTSALNLEASTGEVVVLPIMVASPETVFDRYPLLRDKLYLRWELGPNNIVGQLADLLNRDFKDKWVYCHPAPYSGAVWIRIVTHGDNVPQPHNYMLRWGSWEYSDTLFFDDDRSVSLVHTKSNDGESTPLLVTVSPPCYVSFGQGYPRAGRVVDVNRGWQRVQ